MIRLVGLDMVYHAEGLSELSDTTLNKLTETYGDNASYYIAMVRAYRNELDGAFEWLKKAVAFDDNGAIHEPLLANLHSDPRWLPFLESIGRSPAQLNDIELNIRIPE